MPRDDRYYTFLYTRSSKSRLSIRRVEFSKRKLQLFSFSLLAILGLSSAAVLRNASFDMFPSVNAQVMQEDETSKKLLADVRQKENRSAEQEKDFSGQLVRPDEGRGGPDSTFQLSQQSEDKESVIMESLAQIEDNAEWRQFAPSAWPRVGKINNEFGFRRNPFGRRTYEFHGGLDIDGDHGEPVYAPGAGTVVKAGYQGGYGNTIDIDHGNGITTRYGHLSKIDIQIGDQVTRGQQLGAVGSTGRSTGPHLHFEVRYNDEALNPRRFLPPEPAGLAKK